MKLWKNMLKIEGNKLIFLLKILLLFAVIYYIFFDIDYKNILIHAKNYSFIGLIVMLIIVIIPDLVFSLRWVYSTKETYGFLPSLKAHTLVGMVGFFTPAKLGELLPILYLKKYYNVNTHSTIATLFIVRFLDIVMLASMSVIASFFFFDNINFKLFSMLFLFFIWAFILILFFYKELSYKFCYILPNRSVKAYLIKVLRNLYKTFNRQRVYSVIFFTFLQWLGYFIVTSTFLIFIANFNLTFSEVFVVFVISSIGMALPLAPSGLVTYQASLILGLGWYGIGKDSALASSIILHLIQLSPSLTLYVILFVFNKNKINVEELYDNR